MMCDHGSRCVIHKVAMVLLVVGGLNWGLVAISPDFNLVARLLGSWPMVERVVYALVGLSAIATLFTGACCAKMGMMKGGAASAKA